MISEIIGGIAVIVTLVFLVVEVRANTQAVKSATYDSLVADTVDWRMTIATDNEIQALNFITNTEGRGQLTPQQSNLDRIINVAVFQHYERAFLQWELGNLDDVGWERFKNQMCRPTGNPGFEANVGIRIDEITTERFTSYRKSECND